MMILNASRLKMMNELLVILKPLLSNLGLDGVKSMPVKAILAFPQIRELLPEGVFLALETMPATATVGDIPSDFWLEAVFSSGLTFVTNQLDNSHRKGEDDGGQLVICKSCKKPHYYQ